MSITRISKIIILTLMIILGVKNCLAETSRSKPINKVIKRRNSK